MNQTWFSLRRSSRIKAVVHLVLGTAILLWPQSIFDFFSYILFFYMVAMGGVQLYRSSREQKIIEGVDFQRTGGIFLLVAAFFILIFARGIVSILPILFGLIILLFACTQAVQSWNARIRGFASTGQLIYSILMIIAGLSLLFNPFNSLMLLFRFFGFLLVTMSITEFNHFRQNR
ncbi:membrane protein [Enterococcus florum]|uniref:Membrane protein n=1 Tax=Enterococcus florum TaxID=2480627 RepID=A0A4P5P7Y2_9ENTE|nr:DUF308 domain-containing protein [Enterococcus florum]GCF93616.1 membrane protein [Enterococcus florum]